MLLKWSCLLASVIGAYGASNVRMHVTTKDFCNNDLKDANGDAAPCGVSMAAETYGLTLPGMEDGVHTTVEDVIVAKDGNVAVKAMPNRPFQFLMTVQSPEYDSVEQLYNHQSFMVSENPTESAGLLAASPAGAGLEEGGWSFNGKADFEGKSANKWTKKGPEGMDPTNGANYTAVYDSGLAPDTWVLYTDLANEIPIKMFAINTYNGNKVFQESTFEAVQSLHEDVTVAEATDAMYSTYQVDAGRCLAATAGIAPPVNPKFTAGEFLPEGDRLFFEYGNAVDWLNKRSLRSAGDSEGIAYFTIQPGSAADIFFHALAQRSLFKVTSFEFPTGCSTGKGDKSQKYCLFASVDASLDISLTVKAGMTYVDVVNPDISAHLSLAVTLKKDGDHAVMNLEIEAGGCAVVFQFGEGVSLSINVCITGKASGKDLLQPDKRTFTGELAIAVSFNVNLPKIGNVINWTIDAKVNCTAAPNNVITAYGMIGTSIDIKVAGAGVSLDILGNTVEHIADKWEFVSGVNFNAYVGVWKFKKTWEHRWILWHAGPHQF